MDYQQRRQIFARSREFIERIPFYNDENIEECSWRAAREIAVDSQIEELATLTIYDNFRVEGALGLLQKAALWEEKKDPAIAGLSVSDVCTCQ